LRRAIATTGQKNSGQSNSTHRHRRRFPLPPAPPQAELLKDKLQSIAAEHDRIRIQPAPRTAPARSAANAAAAEGPSAAAAAAEPAVIEIEWGVALMSPWLHRQVHALGLGTPDKPPVKLPAQVRPGLWARQLFFCTVNAPCRHSPRTSEVKIKS
jgi:hypothetical protein